MSSCLVRRFDPSNWPNKHADPLYNNPHKAKTTNRKRHRISKVPEPLEELQEKLICIRDCEECSPN